MIVSTLFFTFSSMSLLPASFMLLLHFSQIKLIEGELMQLTKLEINRRNLDAENLQVGITSFFLCLPFAFISHFIISFGYLHVITP